MILADAKEFVYCAGILLQIAKVDLLAENWIVFPKLDVQEVNWVSCIYSMYKFSFVHVKRWLLFLIFVHSLLVCMQTIILYADVALYQDITLAGIFSLNFPWYNLVPNSIAATCSCYPLALHIQSIKSVCFWYAVFSSFSL